MFDDQLRAWEMQIIAVILLCVLYLVYRAMKEDGWSLSVNKEGLYGHAMRYVDQ